MKSLPVLLCAAVQLQAAEFWNGAVHYDPPFAMVSNPVFDVDGHTNGWDFKAAGLSSATNGQTKVEFRFEDLQTFVGKETAKPIRTVADLRSFSEEMLRAEGQGSYYSGGLAKLDGKEALIYTSLTNRIPEPKRPEGWSCSALLFWSHNAEWQKSTLLEIMITAEKRETLTLLSNSLHTLRVWPEKWRPQR